MTWADGAASFAAVHDEPIAAQLRGARTATR